MAYGLLLYKEISTPQGDQRVEIYKDGFSGSATEITGLRRDGLSISKDNQTLTQPITTSVLTIRLSDCEEIDYSQLFTPNATLFKVIWKTKVSSAWETRWTGFITPDSFGENLAYRDTLTLTARDNLGRLNDYDFDLTRGQMLSVRSILNAAMTKAGVAMGLTYTTTKVATSPATTLAVDGVVNTSLLQGKTWRAAVELLLTGLGLTLSWNDANTFEVRDITQAPASNQSAFFINKSGYRQIQPAWKNLTVEQDYGLRSNFYEGQFTKADVGGAGPSNPTFTPPSGGLWSVDGTMTLLNPYNGAASPLETIYLPIGSSDVLTSSMTYSAHVPSMLRAIKMKITCSNSAWRSNTLRNAIWAAEKIQTGTSQGQAVMHYYWLRYRFNIFLTVGTTKYVMRETWQVYDPSTIEEPYLYFTMPGSEGNVDVDNDVTFYVADLPGAGTLQLTIYPVLAYVTENGDPVNYTAGRDYGRIKDINFAVQDGIGGRAKLVTINADHNVQSSISASVGQVPEGIGNDIAYLGGLFHDDDDYTPLKAYARAEGGSNYDLLELVGREYISYHNAAYDALSGTMMAPSAFRFDKGISFNSHTYRIVGASLAILSNTLSLQVLQQEAAFDTSTYTISDVDVEGGGTSTSSGGIAPGGGGFNNEILRHLSLQVINEGLSNEETIMVCDLTFASEHNLVAGGIGGSDDPSGGGSLAELADVALSSPTEGQVLAYNALTSHWENRTLSFAVSDLTDVTGTPSNGQALVWDSNAGKWKPGTVASGATVVSADATIGTSLTTLGTVDGTPIKAKIAAYLTQAVADGRYGASLNYASGKLYLVNADNTAISTLNGSDLVTAIGNNAVAMATSDANGKTIASQYWVGQQGFLTSSDISDMATMTWVGQQNFLTSSAISDMATQTWVGQQGFITSSALSGYMQTADYTGTGTLAVNRAKADADGNIIKTTYAASLVQGTGKISLVNNNSTEIAHVTGAEIVSAIGTNAVARATADASGNTITTSYLRKDTDDTMSANLTIGSGSSTKSLTIYGGTTENTCGLTIYGGSTKLARIWRDNNYLNIHCNTRIDGDFTATGNSTATGNVVAGSASDRRLKKDIRSITPIEAADLLTVLNPVVYHWNDKASELGGLHGIARGFLADEYLDLLPNAGRKIWGEYDAIDYDQVIPYLVAGWQQQHFRIRELEEELENLRRAVR